MRYEVGSIDIPCNALQGTIEDQMKSISNLPMPWLSPVKSVELAALCDADPVLCAGACCILTGMDLILL